VKVANHRSARVNVREICFAVRWGLPPDTCMTRGSVAYHNYDVGKSGSEKPMPLMCRYITRSAANQTTVPELSSATAHAWWIFKVWHVMGGQVYPGVSGSAIQTHALDIHTSLQNNGDLASLPWRLNTEVKHSNPEQHTFCNIFKDTTCEK